MAYPSDLVRTKNWGTEVLTDSDLEGQFDLIIAWVMAALDATTGHDHTATSNKGPKITASGLLATLISTLTTVTIASGDYVGIADVSDSNNNKKALVSDIIALNAGGILGSAKNLKIVRDSATAVTLTADEIVLEDSSNVKVTVRSFNKQAAITTSGAGGLDTGAEAGNTWYFVWAIRKSSDGTTNLLLSTSSSAPTMPSGYDQKALVSAVRNDGSSNFVDFIQQGRKYYYTTWQTAASGGPGAGPYTSVDITAYVPAALSDFCFGSIVSDNPYDAFVSNKNGTYGAGIANTVGQVGNCTGSWELSILTANTLYWGAATDGGVTPALFIHGFDVNKLAA